MRAQITFYLCVISAVLSLALLAGINIHLTNRITQLENRPEVCHSFTAVDQARLFTEKDDIYAAIPEIGFLDWNFTTIASLSQNYNMTLFKAFPSDLNATFYPVFGISFKTVEVCK